MVFCFQEVQDKATYTVLFYIKRTKELKDGTVPIYARITVNHQRAEFGLQKRIQPTEWDPERGCAEGVLKTARSINETNKLIVSYAADRKAIRLGAAGNHATPTVKV